MAIGKILPHKKYIKVCESTVRVKIERGGDTHLLHFSIRNYPTLEAAYEAAVIWRDETHLKHYGIPVLDKVVQIKGRQKTLTPLNPETGEKLPDLPTGLAYGFHRGRLLYVVTSYQEENRPKRKRFSIKEHGLEAAIEMARVFRDGQINTFA